MLTHGLCLLCIYVGVWRATIDNVDVLSTAVTESLAAAANRGKQEAIPPNQQNISLTAVAYQNGDMRVYNYPCTAQYVSKGYIEFVHCIFVTEWCM